MLRRRWGVIGLLAIAALALGARLWVLTRSSWLLDGDDTLSALMALAILEGDRPLMLKEQTYAGTWQPYAMALSYSLFGVSRVAAKLPGLVASLALVAATWLLARELAGSRAAWLAALLMALPPVYILVLNLKPLAPYTEVAVFGSLALWCAVRLALRRGAAREEPALALGCGVAGGLAFWLHPVAVFYLVPLGLVLLLTLRGSRLVIASGATVVGFTVGALPVWIYNVQTGGATIRFLLSGTRGQREDPLAVLLAWWHRDLPHALGLANPWWEQPWFLSLPLAAPIIVALTWGLFWRPRPLRPRPLDIALIALASFPIIFTLSGFGGPILNPWGFDATGRYSLPIWGGVSVVLGAFLAALWGWRQSIAALLAVAILAVNMYGVAVTDPVRAFQSPYWDKQPADNGPLLDALRSQNVTHVWMNHWAAFPAMLDARAAGQPLIAYDWYDVQAGGIDRYPEHLPLVETAERPAFVLVTDEAETELEMRLRELGVAYERFRAAPYVIVIPIGRRVHPSEVTAALDYRY